MLMERRRRCEWPTECEGWAARLLVGDSDSFFLFRLLGGGVGVGVGVAGEARRGEGEARGRLGRLGGVSRSSRPRLFQVKSAAKAGPVLTSE
jgi:hypothetical protein